MITVNELIEKLNLVKDKSKPIRFFDKYDYITYELDQFCENADEVLIADEIPPEILKKGIPT